MNIGHNFATESSSSTMLLVSIDFCIFVCELARCGIRLPLQCMHLSLCITWTWFCILVCGVGVCYVSENYIYNLCSVALVGAVSLCVCVWRFSTLLRIEFINKTHLFKFLLNRMRENYVLRRARFADDDERRRPRCDKENRNVHTAKRAHNRCSYTQPRRPSPKHRSGSEDLTGRCVRASVCVCFSFVVLPRPSEVRFIRDYCRPSYLRKPSSAYNIHTKNNVRFVRRGKGG